LTCLTVVKGLEKLVISLSDRVNAIESKSGSTSTCIPAGQNKATTTSAATAKESDDDDDGVDLFGSDSEVCT
jgi:hypothetical protein